MESEDDDFDISIKECQKLKEYNLDKNLLSEPNNLIVKNIFELTNVI